MDPLLDTVPPEAAMGRGSFLEKMVDNWSRTKVVGGFLKRSSNMEQHEMA
jgi:hypothetical protein